MIGSWVPGTTPQRLPDGFGMKVSKDAKVVLQMHYHPVGKAETDQSEVALYYAKKADSKSVQTLTLAGLPLNIPPGEKHYRVASKVTLPCDLTLHAIGPHMHQVGREMKVTATLPDGSVKPLVWIRDWDWNWQGRYMYQEPVSLPKGTKIEMEAFYDNSTDNPANPNTPPKMVRFGEQTTDEMCLCFMQVTTAKEEDGALLRRAFIQQLVQGFLPKKGG